MRNGVVRAAVLVLAGVALAGSAYASGSYSGGGIRPPTDKKPKPVDSQTKPKAKKKTGALEYRFSSMLG